MKDIKTFREPTMLEDIILSDSLRYESSRMISLTMWSLPVIWLNHKK